MIQKAGYGVAMEESTSKVIEVSDYITTSNKKDGVAVFLEKILQ